MGTYVGAAAIVVLGFCRAAGAADRLSERHLSEALGLAVETGEPVPASTASEP